jgi:hypothetical protein
MLDFSDTKSDRTPAGRRTEHQFSLVNSGVFRNLERGGAARIFGDLFLGRRPTSKIPVRKNFYDLFFSFLVTFHIFSTSLRRPPQKPAKRHPPHHELQLRGAAPDRLQHRPRQRGGVAPPPPPPKYATACEHCPVRRPVRVWVRLTVVNQTVNSQLPGLKILLT